MLRPCQILGICLYMRKDPFRAAQIWEKALKIDDTPFLRFNPGKLYREMGQTEAAAIHLRYFVQIADRNYSQQKRLALQWLSNP